MVPNQIQIERPETNTRIKLTNIPIFPQSDPRSKITGTPRGNAGIYRVTFVLAVPGREVFRDHLDFETIMQSGDSLLQAAGARFLRITLSNTEASADIVIGCNAKGHLATAQMRLESQGFDEAERTAYNLIAPQLSFWSFLHDVAVDVAGYEIVEESIEAKKYFFGLVGRIKTLNLAQTFVSTPEHRRLLAAYREAMNSTNVFYQALSFFKVAEGATALRKRISRRDNTPLRCYSNERMPTNINDLHIANAAVDELTQEAFQPYLGSSFDELLGQFRALIRNAVAHLGQLDEVLDADHFDDVWACIKAIPILRYIANQLLQNDLGLNSGDVTA